MHLVEQASNPIRRWFVTPNIHAATAAVGTYCLEICYYSQLGKTVGAYSLQQPV